MGCVQIAELSGYSERQLYRMFDEYLENYIPKTTNALESFFGHLKENITLHRGMSNKHYQHYVKWYLYFRNKDNKKRAK